MRTYWIDGQAVNALASLCEAFAQAVGAPAGSWGMGLHSFDDRSSALETRDYLDERGQGWLIDTHAKAERGERALFDEVVEGISTVSARSRTAGKLHLLLR